MVTTQASLLYFAYGSNMLPQRLVARVGPCDLLGVATLPGHRLAFHKRGRDGSGKCDLVADTPDALAYGVLFRLHPDQKRVLDGFEGPGYLDKPLEVLCTTGPQRAIAYFAHPEHIDPDVRPFDWYRAIVLLGARAALMPQSYCLAIANTPAQLDPDSARAAEAWRVLLTKGTSA